MLKWKNGRLFFRISKNLFLVFVAILFLLWRPSAISSEVIRMTSYYPAPYGGYDRLFTTGNTYLAHSSGNVYWGPDSTSMMSRDQGGSIILASPNMYSSPAIKFVSSSGITNGVMGVGYIGMEAVFTVAGDLYVNGLRRVCRVQRYEYQKKTYCSGNAHESTKYVAIIPGRKFPNSGNMLCCRFETVS